MGDIPTECDGPPCSHEEVVVLCSGIKTVIKITSTYLDWSPSNEITGDSDSVKRRPDLHGPLYGKIPMEDIVAAKQSAKAKSFKLFFVKRDRKNSLLYNIQNEQFECDDETMCKRWIGLIQDNLEKLPSKRPKRLLIFINPQSGSKNGRKIYDQQVSPVFDIAGITTDVIVTERQNHATEVLQTYDLSNIDGVVCFGGDGTFSECFNGLLLRSIKDSGKSKDDPDCSIEPSPVKLGCVGSGTGNGCAKMMYGTMDPTTAALHISLGAGDIKLGAAALFSAGELFRYNFMLFGLGLNADFIYEAERNRRFGKAGKYIWSLLKNLKTHPIDLKLEYQPVLDEHVQPDSATSQDDMQQGWQELTGRFNDLVSFSYPMSNGKGVADLSHSGTWHLYAVHECSFMDYLRFMQMATKWNIDPSTPYVKHLHVKAFKITIIGGGKPRENNLYPVNQDGEGLLLPETSMDIRLHKDVVHCFGIHNSLIDKEENIPSS